jgi:hypothetical protein
VSDADITPDGVWDADDPIYDSEIEGDEPMAYPQRGNGNRGEKKEPYVHKDNRGSMFENDRIENDKSPDFKGSINVNGTVYWINGWKNGGEQGKKRYLSLSVQKQDDHMRDGRDQASPPQESSKRRGSW